MDRLKALSVFKAVADRGSFGAAASALDISVGAVSRTVQDLEGLLGARLLHRTTRRVALTAVGEDVLSRVGGLLQSYDELAAIGQLSTNEPAGMIRMAAPALFARSYLGPRWRLSGNAIRRCRSICNSPKVPSTRCSKRWIWQCARPRICARR